MGDMRTSSHRTWRIPRRVVRGLLVILLLINVRVIWSRMAPTWPSSVLPDQVGHVDISLQSNGVDGSLQADIRSGRLAAQCNEYSELDASLKKVLPQSDIRSASINVSGPVAANVLQRVMLALASNSEQDLAVPITWSVRRQAESEDQPSQEADPGTSTPEEAAQVRS